MGSGAQIDEGAASVSSHPASIWDFVGDERHFERVVTEKSESFNFGQNKPVELLFLLDYLFDTLLNFSIVVFSEHILLAGI